MSVSVLSCHTSITSQAKTKGEHELLIFYSLGLKREWLIGVRLNKLRGPDGELEGRQPSTLLSSVFGNTSARLHGCNT